MTRKFLPIISDFFMCCRKTFYVITRY